MPTLFISYKRLTGLVGPILEKLRAAHYRLWFDKDEIHLGDPDWQARIDLGLQISDGVVLCITAEALTSEPIRYEVRKALEFKKPIFGLILETGISSRQAIEGLGLPDHQHIEKFIEENRWQENLERLLDSLVAQGLRVRPHDLRRPRDPTNPHYILHQRYLNRLAETVGSVPLAQINPDQTDAIDLEKIYVDSPTGLALSVEVTDWHVVDWWLPRPDQPDRERPGRFSFGAEKEGAEQARPKPEELGYERPPFEALVGKIEQEIERYREATPEARPDDDEKYYRGRNPWNNGVHEKVLQLHLGHLAAACNRLVVLGAPGSGKSTFVRYLALCLAGSNRDDWTRPATIEKLDNWPHGPLTPVYIELRRFVASPYFPSKLGEPATTDHLWSYIENEVLGDDLRLYAADLRYDLEHGQALLILDGLDEVPYPEGGLRERRTQLVNLARSLDTRYSGSRVLVTSRPYAYEGWSLPGFKSVTITAFEDKHRLELAARLYRAVGLGEEQAQAQAERLNVQLKDIHLELKDRPLFVTLLATLFHKRGGAGLPTRRGTLYRESILLLLERWTKSKPGAPSLVDILGEKTPADLYTRLAGLAYAVHEQYGEQPGTPEIAYTLLHHHLKPLGKHLAVDLISYLCENAGVLVSPGQNEEKDVFQFAHRTFQEYLAAQHLVGLCQGADSFGLVGQQITLKPQAWRVPCSMVGDVLADTDRKSDLWSLVGDLLEADPPPVSAGNDPRWWLVWLAGRIAQEQELYAQPKLHRRTEQPVRDALVEWLVALLQTPGALPPRERAESGGVLALLGDPRPGVGNVTANVGGRELELPRLEWCDIPAPPGGKVWLGADDQKDNPRREVALNYSFKMAKYPITYRQFQTFSDSGEYADPRWWTDFPEGYAPQPLDERYRKPTSYPRDTVSWYQAVAFTRWLTERYRAAGQLDPGQEIRLPSEGEWEYAARGTDEREYTYLGPFDPTKGNTYQTGIGRSSVVGCFPDGASPFGVLGMSGQVWEWCLNNYSQPAEKNISSNMTDYKRLRGGSFDYDAYYAACAYRFDFDPHLDYNFLGLRVVVASHALLFFRECGLRAGLAPNNGGRLQLPV